MILGNCSCSIIGARYWESIPFIPEKARRVFSIGNGQKQRPTYPKEWQDLIDFCNANGFQYLPQAVQG
jgi:hypothetical protein